MRYGEVGRGEVRLNDKKDAASLGRIVSINRSSARHTVSKCV
jgi:hypothetical protein